MNTPSLDVVRPRSSHEGRPVRFSNQVLAFPATRNRRGIPTEVAVDHADGMPQESVFTVEDTSLVRTSLLTERITVLSPAVMADVCLAFRAAMDCGPFVGRRADVR